jgi:hypothetical protein
MCARLEYRRLAARVVSFSAWASVDSPGPGMQDEIFGISRSEEPPSANVPGHQSESGTRVAPAASPPLQGGP